MGIKVIAFDIYGTILASDDYDTVDEDSTNNQISDQNIFHEIIPLLDHMDLCMNC